MINGIDNNLGVGGAAGTGPATGAPKVALRATSFADTLKNSINEVSRLQEDASQAVADLTTGKTQNVTGVISAMEKSDLAFKTLLSIRSKLLDAYDEIKNMPI